MWETSQGTRTLTGAEAYLIKELVHYLHDQILVGIEIGEPHFSDVAVFDCLQPTQQLVTLYTVARGLLDPAAAPPKLTATCEGTIYAIFRELETLIEAEIEFEKDSGLSDYSIRSLARAAYIPVRNPSGVYCDLKPEMKSGIDQGWDAVPQKECTVMERWSDFIELLADNILWDRDFQFDRIVGDVSPDQAGLIKQQLGINEDYYSSVAQDIREVDIAEISALIGKLTPATQYADSHSSQPDPRRNIA